jgi:hypothetical protein
MVSENDRAYMKRLGEYKAAAHREALEAHLALSLEERLERSWQLYELFRDQGSETERGDDALELYAKARRLGLYIP